MISRLCIGRSNADVTHHITAVEPIYVKNVFTFFFIHATFLRFLTFFILSTFFILKTFIENFIKKFKKHF